MKRLVLIGAGEHGRVVADVAEAAGWTDIVFLDRDFPKRDRHDEWKILGSPHADIAGKRFVAIGNNRSRMAASELFADDAAILVHPFSAVSRHAKLGPGVVVMPGVVVNSGARIGPGVILNTSCSVDHDCEIGAFSHIAPGAHLSGHVHTGPLTWIGVGACVKEGINIGREAFVAAGAAVVKDVSPGRLVRGVPARDTGPAALSDPQVI